MPREITLWQAQALVRHYGMVENLVRHSQSPNRVEGMGFGTARELARNQIHTLSQLLYCYASCGESWLCSLCDSAVWRENVRRKLSPGVREMLVKNGFAAAAPAPAEEEPPRSIAPPASGGGDHEMLRGMMEEIRMLRSQLQSVCDTIATQRDVAAATPPVPGSKPVAAPGAAFVAGKKGKKKGLAAPVSAPVAAAKKKPAAAPKVAHVGGTENPVQQMMRLNREKALRRLREHEAEVRKAVGEARAGLEAAKTDLDRGAELYGGAQAALAALSLDADEDLLAAEYGWPNGALVMTLHGVRGNLVRTLEGVRADRASDPVQLHARCVAGVAQAEKRLSDRDLAGAVSRGLVADKQVREALRELREAGGRIAEEQAGRACRRDLDDHDDAGTWQAVATASRMCQASGLDAESSETVARLWEAIERHNAAASAKRRKVAP